MNTSENKNAYKLLLKSGTIPPDLLEIAFKDAERRNESLTQALVSTGKLQEPEILNVYSKMTGYPRFQPKEVTVDPSVLTKVPVKFAAYYRFFPFQIVSGRLQVATARVMDLHTLDEMRFTLGCDMDIYFALEREVEELMSRYYGLAAETVDRILQESPSAVESPERQEKIHQLEGTDDRSSSPSVIHIVNQIMMDAYRRRASDIHIEPYAGGIRLRYRVDGELQEAPVPNQLREFFDPLISRIKIMANLNVAEKRLPQDGKVRVKIQNETLDLRVSFLPTVNGESAVIRILPSKNIFQLEHLGFSGDALVYLKELFKKPNGIVFMTGPTGSGKSTTLYAALNQLNAINRKIITIEDPVEYELDGITQINVNPEIGLSFASALRSMLRQDPDVMMVGEVRDFETADIAIRAALTGHLILSTIHTNDAASAATRLLDIGVQPYLIASSVNAFVAQRLVRKLCPHCRKENTNLSQEITVLIRRECRQNAQGARIYKSTGCENCGGTGYLGRIALSEILVLTENTRLLISKRATAEEIKKKAVQEGMVTLRQDGWRKVLEGVTSIEEILEVTPSDGDLGNGKGLWMPAQKDNFGKEEKGNALKDNLLPLTGQRELSKPVQKDKAVSDKNENASAILDSIEKDLMSSENKPKEELYKQSDAELDFVNLRKYKRVDARVELAYRIIEYKGKMDLIQKLKARLQEEVFDGHTSNLSAGGLVFYTEDWPIPGGESGSGENDAKVGDALEAGNLLEVTLRFSHEGREIRCMGRILRVVRYAETVSGSSKFYYHVAVLFLVIDSEDRAYIEKYCQGYTGDESV